jgi:hypothetical protein
VSDSGSQIRGFWPTCWTFRDKIVWSWDFLAFVLLVGAAYALPSDQQVGKLSEPLATAALALGAALVGVVVAGLAVVVALLDDDFLVLMDRDEKSGRVAGHLFPYWFVTGVGVATFLLALLLLLAGAALPAWASRAVFAFVCGLVVWTALGVFNLVGSLQALGLNRALNAKLKRPK